MAGNETLPVPGAVDASDRNHEGIACEASPLELQQIEEELGFVPTNLVRVSAFFTPETKQLTPHSQLTSTDSLGIKTTRPAVLLLYPLRNCEDAYKKHQRAKVEPFPTIYWLAASELKTKVSLLEDQQYVQIFQDRLDNNAEAREIMARSHLQYAEERWRMLTAADMKLVQDKRWTRALRDVGIAGIRNFASVKCLHTHYAHYLATKNNLIGAWVQELLDQMTEQAVPSALSRS